MDETHNTKGGEHNNKIRKPCGNCITSKTACDHQRPCKRCISKGVEHTCQDVARKERTKRARLSPHSEEEDTSPTISPQIKENNFSYMDLNQAPNFATPDFTRGNAESDFQYLMALFDDNSPDLVSPFPFESANIPSPAPTHTSTIPSNQARSTTPTKFQYQSLMLTQTTAHSQTTQILPIQPHAQHVQQIASASNQFPLAQPINSKSGLSGLANSEKNSVVFEVEHYKNCTLPLWLNADMSQPPMYRLSKAAQVMDCNIQFAQLLLYADPCEFLFDRDTLFLKDLIPAKLWAKVSRRWPATYLPVGTVMERPGMFKNKEGKFLFVVQKMDIASDDYCVATILQVKHPSEMPEYLRDRIRSFLE